MNIFATGMNPADSNNLRRNPRVALFQAFAEAMQFLQTEGHHLKWHRMLVGQPLPLGTDAVIVSSMLPRSLNCPYALGVMWTISEALRQDVPLVIYLTDWKFYAAHIEFNSIAKAGPEYFFKTIGGKLQYDEPHDEVVEHSAELLEICRQYGDPKSKLWRNVQVLVPRYTYWGDPRIIQRMLPGANPILTMDPTPLFLEYLDTDPRGKLTRSYEHREKRWTLPSLLNDNTWLDRQGLTWPVDRFGPKGFDVVPDERGVQLEYIRRRGALCPPYPTVGSGWWRSRWIHSARAKSVLLCSPKEGFGSAYRFSGSAYEAMGSEQMEHVAHEQQTVMYSLLQTEKSVLLDQLMRAFKEAGA